MCDAIFSNVEILSFYTFYNYLLDSLNMLKKQPLENLKDKKIGIFSFCSFFFP